MNTNYDFQEAQELMYNKEVLTADEAEMCFQIMPAMAKAVFVSSQLEQYLS
jgi:hypothetical protein